MSSDSKMVAFERQLQRAKLLVTLTTEAKDKLVLNEKYLRHLRGLQAEGVKTSVALKTCHEERSSAAIAALEELAHSLEGVDRNKEAVDQLKERVAALGLKINLSNVADSSTVATSSEQCLATQTDVIEVGAEPKRVQSSSPGLGAHEGASRVLTRAQEVYPKRFTKNSIIKHFDLPRNHDEFFNAFRSDLPPERFMELHRRLSTIPEDEDEDEKPSASGSHCPLM